MCRVLKAVGRFWFEQINLSDESIKVLSQNDEHQFLWYNFKEKPIDHESDKFVQTIQETIHGDVHCKWREIEN
jgi:hypothetical protein